YKKVSVVIPNYNYGRYLDERFNTITDQTYPIYEIIFLDDCSSDNSIEIAKKYASNCAIHTRIILNDANSGSVFKQWKKGIETTRGDYVWIAEADDFCDKLFLEHLVPSLYDSEVILAYSQSAPVDENGRLHMPDYRPYTADLSETRWNSAYTNEGIDEIRDYLSIKNTIPNASAVVFRREGATMPGGIQDFRFVGDWFFYMNLLQNGKIAFVPEVLNFHRRHGKTVTNKMELDETAIIEQLQVKIWILEQIKLPATRIAPCVAHVISEYYRLSELHNISRAPFMKNPVLKPWIDRLRELVSDALMEKHNQKSLLIVIGDAEVGGGQIAAVRLANQWSKQHRVFLCNARPEALDKVLVDLIDPDVMFLEGAPGQSEWSKGERSVKHLNSRISETHRRVAVVRDLIEFYRIDIIMSHIWWADRFVYAINKELQIPWFIQMHGCYEALISYPEWDSEFTKLAPEIMRLAAGVCYLSPKNLLIFDKGLAAKPAFMREFDNALELASIPNPINDNFARGVDDFVFCLCTRAIPEKGWEEAINATLEINALSHEARKGKRARLLLIGEGEYKRTLQAKYAGHEEIEFMGRVPDQFSVIHSCDVGLLPSRFVSESKPLTVIEYLACSKPVIATTIGSIPEMIAWDDREAGILIRHDLEQELFVDALREAMLRYIRNQELIEEHKRNARIIFDAQFDLEKVAQQYLTFFSKAVNNGHKDISTNSPDENGDQIYQAIRQHLEELGNHSHTSLIFQDDILNFIREHVSCGDAVIEVGCYRGGLTAQLAQLCAHFGKLLYVIDIDKEYLNITKDSVRAICNDKHVHYYCGDLLQFVQEGICTSQVILAFIDGDHRYEGVVKDVEALYLMKPIPFAMAFHDFSLRYATDELKNVRVDRAIIDCLGDGIQYQTLGEIAGQGKILKTTPGEDGHYHEEGKPEGVLLICSEVIPHEK
ncbi:MAG: glycosyltransferase, partial [Methanosarcinales archaeon]|nr:glycosyltransferase [Methanosarcinales archaeon]